MNKSKIIVEICCGSFYDALQAWEGGAKRIELNSALMLGGLTPSTATLKLVKQNIPDLKVIAMVRPRGAGFCYTKEEFQVMEEECLELLEAGADGIAFGCLSTTGILDREKNIRLISMIKRYDKEAVFHRAFDVVPNPMETIEELIALGVNRVLTSGQKEKAMDGSDLIKLLQKKYSGQIEILAGSGINDTNANKLIQYTGIYQVHSSCKDWKEDPTTKGNGVSYSMVSGEKEMMYDVVSAKMVSALLDSVH